MQSFLEHQQNVAHFNGIRPTWNPYLGDYLYFVLQNKKVDDFS